MNEAKQRTPLEIVLVRCGAVIWVLGAIQFFSLLLIVQSAWTTPYSWSLNTVSDLGNMHCQPWGDDARYVCSPLHGFMDTSIVIEGIFIVVGVILIRSLWRQMFLSRAARNLLVIAGLAIILVGLVPADVNENLHVLGALFITVCGNLGLMLTGFASRASHMRGIRILAVAMGSLGLIATGLFFSGHYLGLGMGGMERFAVFTVQIWTFVAGGSLLISSVSGSHRTDGETAVGTHHDQRI
jgi:hypothetical membrane protein